MDLYTSGERVVGFGLKVGERTWLSKWLAAHANFLEVGKLQAPNGPVLKAQCRMAVRGIEAVAAFKAPTVYVFGDLHDVWEAVVKGMTYLEQEKIPVGIATPTEVEITPAELRLAPPVPAAMLDGNTVSVKR